jgi:subtilisin-like proprotein convertase family protein
MLHRLARLGMSLLLLVIILSALQPAVSIPAARAQDSTPLAEGVFRGESTAAQFDISPALGELPIPPLPEAPQVLREIAELDSGLEGPPGPQDSDTLVQDQVGQANINGPILTFNAMGNISSVTPPDPVGDVGPNHYIAMSNLSFQIFDKVGNSLFGPAPNNLLWTGFGGACETENAGDPIVLYDQFADRWLLSQFTAAGPAYYNCVAISTSGNPLGTYYRYAFSTGINFPDYPKLAVWGDSYFISNREFANGSTFIGIGAYAINRAQMIAGNPTPQVVGFLVQPGVAAYNIGDGLLPADIDGDTLPPTNSPGYFMGVMDNGYSFGAPQDALTLWKFTVDYANPAASNFALTNTLPVAPFDSVFPCTPGFRNCIPQPGTTNKIDILSYRQRLMHRLAYRNFGTHEALVTNHSVEATTGMAGIRWYEVRSPNSSPVVYQQGTYAPGTTDGIHRWMGSIAMDRLGNMALGYSVSDGTSTYPGIRYTARLAGDPLNTLPQGEGVILNGFASQGTSARWGDYTSMNVDPVDDCTFWYINQFIATTGTNWRLRVGAFRLPGCFTADLSIVKGASPLLVLPGSVLDYTLDVTNHGPTRAYLVGAGNNNTQINFFDILPAAPYPSQINVTDMAGTIQKVRVSLAGVTHTFSDDIDVLLVGPGGQTSLLMSDAGGSTDLSNASLTFDSTVANPLPDNTQITSGVYQPTDFATGDVFPAPAPAGPFTADLAVFNGTSPTGTWSLYAFDDTNGDTGQITSGWSITFFLEPLVKVVDTLPAGVSYNGFSGTDWSCSAAGQVVTCLYTVDLPGQAPLLTLHTTAPLSPGLIDNQATVSSPLPDLDLSDNTDSQLVLVPWQIFLPVMVK